VRRSALDWSGSQTIARCFDRRHLEGSYGDFTKAVPMLPEATVAHFRSTPAQLALPGRPRTAFNRTLFRAFTEAAVRQ